MKPANKDAPSFWETVNLVAGLRFKLFFRGFTNRGIIGAFISLLFALTLSCGLGFGAYFVFSLVTQPQVDPLWLPFLLSIFSFLLGLFWILWPVVAAQIDEAQELGRFFFYPVSPARMHFIQTTSSLLEPGVLFFYPPLAGLCFALVKNPETNITAIIVASLSFVLMIVTSGQLLKSIFLNIMKSRRSGEILMVGFLFLLGLAAFIPPVDGSWLFARMDSFGSAPEDLSLLAQTSTSLQKTPPGWFASALISAHKGHIVPALMESVAMVCIGVVSWILGLSLLLRFYKGKKGKKDDSKSAIINGITKLFHRNRKVEPIQRAEATKTSSKNARAIITSGLSMRLTWPGLDGSTSAVFAKEMRTLTANPKARLLLAVPFFLLIILKIIGAPQLFFYLWGEAWASSLMGFLSIYVLSVLSGQLFANGFGFDGHGIRQVFFYPIAPIKWLRGRNLAQAIVAVIQLFLLWALVLASMDSSTTQRASLPLGGLALTLPVLLGLGNELSVKYPRRFYFSLSRRDRPVAASFFSILGVLSLCTTTVIGLFHLHESFLNSFGSKLLPCGVLLVFGVFFYILLTKKAAERLLRESENLIGSIAK